MWLQGPMDKAAWQAIIPNMGYFALLRNLRNFDEAGIDAPDGRVRHAGRLCDEEAVSKSKLFRSASWPRTATPHHPAGVAR